MSSFSLSLMRPPVDTSSYHDSHPGCFYFQDPSHTSEYTVPSWQFFTIDVSSGTQSLLWPFLFLTSHHCAPRWRSRPRPLPSLAEGLSLMHLLHTQCPVAPKTHSQMDTLQPQLEVLQCPLPNKILCTLYWSFLTDTSSSCQMTVQDHCSLCQN